MKKAIVWAAIFAIGFAVWGFSAQQDIDPGTAPGAGDGATNYANFVAAESNDTELYSAAVTAGDGLTGGGVTVTGATIDVDVKNSIEIDADELQLVGDADTPGNTKLYGTNGSGTKGWYDQSTDTQNLFETVATQYGTHPVAELPDDTLNVIGANGFIVLGDQASDTMVLADTNALEVIALGILDGEIPIGSGDDVATYAAPKASIEVDVGQLQLDGDAASPGNSMLYGTNAGGTKGWYAQGSLSEVNNLESITTGILSGEIPVGSGDGLVTYAAPKASIEVDAGQLQLDGDAASPGNTKLYGTNAGGAKGWYDQPVDTDTNLTQEEVDAYVDALINDLDSVHTDITITYDDGANAMDFVVDPHDDLTGFVPDEHVDHSAVTLTAGNGLTGGGDITTDRSFVVSTDHSVTIVADDVQLVNDEDSPGNSQLYGTNAGGTKGWYDQGSLSEVNNLESITTGILSGEIPVGSGDGLVTYAAPKASIEVDAGQLQLDGDSTSPGNSMLYGTNAGGTKGWYAQGSLSEVNNLESITTGITNGQIPVGSGSSLVTYAAPKHSVTVDVDHAVMLLGDAASPGNSKLYGTNAGGTRGWYDQPVDTDTNLTQEEVDAYVDALINDLDSVHTDITITYDDINNAMDFVVDPHDDLTGFVPDEHVDHSAVTLTAGNGLTGGGDITTNRSFAVGVDHSVTIAADAVQLVGDEDTPGNSKLYGTNAGGTKGWYDQLSLIEINNLESITTGIVSGEIPVGSGDGLVTYAAPKASIEVDAGQLQLDGDSTSPGNSMLYGTNAGGTKGWYAQGSLSEVNNLESITTGILSGEIPVGSGDGLVTYAAPKASIEVDAGQLQLDGDAETPGNTKLYGTNGSGTRGWYDQPVDTDTDTHLTQEEVDAYVDALINDLDSVHTDITITYDDGANAMDFVVDPHDDLTGFVPDEHVDHSAVTLTAGNGLTGGGDITTNRSFAVGVDHSVTISADAVQLVNDEDSPGTMQLYGTSGAGAKGWFAQPVDTNTQLTDEQVWDLIGDLINDLDSVQTDITVTYQDGTDSLDFVVDPHDELTGFVANEHIDWTQDQGATDIHAGNYIDTDTDTQLSQEQVDDFVNALINDGDSVHTDITITYDDAANAMDFVVDPHDELTGFVANEHIDWTQDQGATDIHAGNYIDTDTDTQLSQEQVDDFVNALINDGDSVHTDITITYDDAANAMDFVVDQGNAFTEVNVLAGSSPQANSSTDTLNLRPGANITMVGDQGSDTIIISAVPTGETNSLETITTGITNGQIPVGSGSSLVTYAAPKHSVTVDGDSSVMLVGDVATPGGSKIYGTDEVGDRGWVDPPALQNLFSKINPSDGDDADADSPTDTLNLSGGTDISVTGTAGDTITIAYTGSAGGDPDQNLFESVTGDTGTATADLTDDSIAVVGGSNGDGFGDFIETVASGTTTDKLTISLNSMNGAGSDGYPFVLDGASGRLRHGGYVYTNGRIKSQVALVVDTGGHRTAGTAEALIYGYDDGGWHELWATTSSITGFQITPHDANGRWIHHSFCAPSDQELYIEMQTLIRFLAEMYAKEKGIPIEDVYKLTRMAADKKPVSPPPAQNPPVEVVGPARIR